MVITYSSGSLAAPGMLGTDPLRQGLIDALTITVISNGVGRAGGRRTCLRHPDTRAPTARRS